MAEQIQIVIDSKLNAAGLKAAASEVKNLGAETQAAEKTTKSFGETTRDQFGQILKASASIAAGVIAVKKVFEFAEQGAQLEYTTDKFDRLSESIGTTSDVLLNDLKNATRGMKSDADLMAGATDFMALGLAKSHDEVVRLTNVAGALNMNMNQLVLTLTNQTTMRFDQLGVSVDGFKEKVAALEESGLSAGEAFKEAFLQQAEEQIGRVGHVADSAAGSFEKLKASTENWLNQVKLSTVGPVSDLVDIMTTGFDNATVVQTFNNLSGVAKELGIDITSLTDKQTLMGEAFYNTGVPAVDALRRASFYMLKPTEELNKEIAELIARHQALNQMRNRGTNANYDYSVSLNTLISRYRTSIELSEDFATTLEGVTSVTSVSNNFKGILEFAKNYDKLLEKLQEEEEVLANNPAWTKKAKDAQGAIEEIKAAMAGMANQMTLDMFQATIAIGGVTEAEARAYFKMAEDMGIISAEAANAAMDAYGNAVSTINGMNIDTKTGEITMDAAKAIDTLEWLQSYVLLDKEMRVFVRQYVETGGMTQDWASGNYDTGYTPNFSGGNGPQSSNSFSTDYSFGAQLDRGGGMNVTINNNLRDPHDVYRVTREVQRLASRGGER